VSVQALERRHGEISPATRGGGESLQRSLALSGRLTPLSAGENGIQRFQLHH
jgi:hypothetical protein